MMLTFWNTASADPGGRITEFLEKPTDPPGLPDSPDEVYASMGNYIFDTQVLLEALHTDAADAGSSHDMGGDLLPALVAAQEANVYDFSRNEVPGATARDRGYWRDVGTLDTYYEASMDLVSVHPVFNLYNDQWPIFTNQSHWPPAKFVFEEHSRRGQAFDSLVSAGVIVAGGTARRSVLSPGVRIEPGALVGPGAVVRHAIVDKNVVIAPGATLGVDPDADAERFTVSPRGVVVVGKGDKVTGA
jgi:glucose-1-phosphate adenylyltransferase